MGNALNMEPVVIAIVVGIAVYVLLISLIPARIFSESTKYTRSMLDKLAENSSQDGTDDNDTLSVLRAQTRSSGIMARLFFLLPGSNAVYPSLLHAGLANHVGGFFTSCLVVLGITSYMLTDFGLLGQAGAFGLSFLFGRWYIRKRIRKRNGAFLDAFPDALDMIVRSVRSGYPLNAAVRMVADNMEAPVSTEFKQVADEVAYGSTLIEALQRMAFRISEPDVRFFVVVLTVQQDVGGNLSEVLNNLGSIIRKRKYLRLKIKALSSEGRATAWVLGSMPVAEALLIWMVAPKHMAPLLTTPLGHTMLAGTVGIVLLGVLIVRQMVNIKV
jgi:Flp pilus assembly protein TadB